MLVFHDVLGLYDRLRPKFVKQYASLGEAAVQALTQYANEVRNADFPGPEHAFSMDQDAFAHFQALASQAAAATPDLPDGPPS